MPDLRASFFVMERLRVVKQQVLCSSPCSAPVALREQKDLVLLDDLLSPEQKQLRQTVAAFAEEYLATERTNASYEKAEFPHDIIGELGKINVAGCGMYGYNCAGRDVVSAGLVALELGKRDGGIATFLSILQTISMVAIYKCGNEAQKQKYLPAMASMEKIGCFGLTEPESGSDASNLSTTATRKANGWVLNGQKRWIGNGTFADIYIIWAMNAETKQVNGFIVEKGTPGLTSTKIENKIGLRCVQNADIYLTDCFVTDDCRLPLATNFATGPGNCLFLTRLSTAWIACGMALGALESALEYTKQRKQFGQPLAKLQIIQERLARMLSICQSTALLVWRASVMCDDGKLSLGQVGLCKAHATSQARVVVSLAREIVGGNGMLTDYLVGKHFVDIEGLHTFEGSYDINVLVGMRELTGQSAIKPRK